MPLLFAPMIGRFGNLLFIYAYARAWAEQNGYELCLYPWVGEQAFTIPHAVRPTQHKPDLVWTEIMYQWQDALIYTRKQVKEWFTLRPEVLDKLREIQPAELMLDVREGPGGEAIVCVSRQSYIDAAIRFGYDPAKASWEIGPHGTRLPAFPGNVDAAGLGTTMVSIPAFYRLMISKVHFRGVSTFSWWAATLGNAKVYAPDITGMKRLPDQYCDNFVEGNWPLMSDTHPNTDLHLREC